MSHLFAAMIADFRRAKSALIEQMFPKSVHAVTAQGFALKVALFVIAYSLNCYLNL